MDAGLELATADGGRSQHEAGNLARPGLRACRPNAPYRGDGPRLAVIDLDFRELTEAIMEPVPAKARGESGGD